MKKLLKKAIKVHQFDPVIYPYTLWVAITDNLEEIKTRFTYYDYTPLEIKLKSYYGVTFDVRDELKTRGSLILFSYKKYMTVGYMAHEASHVADNIFEYIGEDHPSDEAKAYLIEWIVDCINQVKINKFK